MNFPRQNIEAERHERASFMLLQHAYAWSRGKPDVPISTERLGPALGLAGDELAELLQHLVWIGYLGVHSEGVQVTLRPAGIEYIECLSWRRVAAPSRPR